MKRPTPWLPFPRVVVVALVLGVGLALPSLDLGFVLDDYFILDQIEGAVDTRGLNFYESFEESIQMPWWRAEDWRITFWRPLSSVLLWLDHALFGRWAVGWHLHSLLWLTALIACAGALYRRLPPAVGGLALVLFAVDDSHALTSGVLCNRHMLVSTALGALGVLFHLSWREKGWRPGLPLSLAAFVASLAGGEAAISVMAYVAAYELVAGPDSFRRRMVSLAPLAGLVLIFLAWYSASDYGAHQSSFYVDPVDQPTAFLTAASGRVPALLAGALAGVPASLWMFEAVRAWQIAFGLLAVLGVVGIARSSWSALDESYRRELSWWALGALGSLLPLVAAPPSERQLLVPALGFSVTVAAVLVHWWNRWRTDRRRLAAGLAIVFGLMHFVVAPLSRVAALQGFRGVDRDLEQALVQLPEQPGGEDLIIINAPNVFVTLYVPSMRRYDGATHPWDWQVLSAAPYDHDLVRTDQWTLELEVIDGQMMSSPPEQFVRPPGDLPEVGEVIETERFRVEILAANERGPTRVSFRFPRPLEELDLILVVWNGQFEPMSLPAVGEKRRLTAVAGPETRI